MKNDTDSPEQKHRTNNGEEAQEYNRDAEFRRLLQAKFQAQNPEEKWSLSFFKCYVCNQEGHYSLDCNKVQTKPSIV